MPAAIAVPAIMSAVGTGAAVVGQRKQAKAAKKAAAQQQQTAQQASQMFTPAQILANAQQLNPQLFAALAGQRGTTGYQQAIYNMAQNPGYIDPSLMNAPYTMSAQRQQSDLLAAQGMLGRNDAGGSTGIGQAYALANLGARTARDVNLGQQYGLWRSQQARADTDWLSQQRQQALNAAAAGAQGQAQYWAQQPPPAPGMNWGQAASDVIGSGLAAYGQMKGLGGGGGTPSWQGPAGTFRNPSGGYMQ